MLTYEPTCWPPPKSKLGVHNVLVTCEVTGGGGLFYKSTSKTRTDRAWRLFRFSARFQVSTRSILPQKRGTIHFSSGPNHLLRSRLLGSIMTNGLAWYFWRTSRLLPSTSKIYAILCSWKDFIAVTFATSVFLMTDLIVTWKLGHVDCRIT